MSDTDLAGLNAQDEGAILAEIRPMPAFSRLEAGTGGERPRPGGNGGRPDAGGPPLRRVIEAVLFASDKPVSLAELAEAAPGCQQCDLTQRHPQPVANQ